MLSLSQCLLCPPVDGTFLVCFSLSGSPNSPTMFIIWGCTSSSSPTLDSEFLFLGPAPQFRVWPVAHFAGSNCPVPQTSALSTPERRVLSSLMSTTKRKPFALAKKKKVIVKLQAIKIQQRHSLAHIFFCLNPSKVLKK